MLCLATRGAREKESEGKVRTLKNARQNGTKRKTRQYVLLFLRISPRPLFFRRKAAPSRRGMAAASRNKSPCHPRIREGKCLEVHHSIPHPPTCIYWVGVTQHTRVSWCASHVRYIAAQTYAAIGGSIFLPKRFVWLTERLKLENLCAVRGCIPTALAQNATGVGFCAYLGSCDLLRRVNKPQHIFWKVFSAWYYVWSSSSRRGDSEKTGAAPARQKQVLPLQGKNRYPYRRTPPNISWYPSKTRHTPHINIAHAEYHPPHRTHS